MIELHIDPCEFGHDEYDARITDLETALRRLSDAVEFDTVDLAEALRTAKRLLA